MNVDPIITLVSVPAIIALVNLAKKVGLEARLGTLLAVVLGLGLAFGQAYIPDEQWAIISEGLLLGLGAAGLYEALPGPRDALSEIPRK